MARRKTRACKPVPAEPVDAEPSSGSTGVGRSGTAAPPGSAAPENADAALSVSGEFLITRRELDAIERMLGGALADLLESTPPKGPPRGPCDDDS